MFCTTTTRDFRHGPAATDHRCFVIPHQTCPIKISTLVATTNEMSASTPFIDAPALLEPFTASYDYDLRQAHSESGNACAHQGARGSMNRHRLPCGEGGIVASCPRTKSVLDTWVTGYDNSIYAVNGATNFPWPEETKDSAWGCQRMAWQPKLLSSTPGIMNNMHLGKLSEWNTGGGYAIQNVYGLHASPEAFQSTMYGLSEDQATYRQRRPPPRIVREPRAGTWIR